MIWQGPGVSRVRHPCLLLSGGVDSALVARFLIEAGTPPTGLFVDYGQPAAKAEAHASTAIAAAFGLSRECVTIGGLSVPSSGEIIGRNDLLIAVARAAAPGRDVALGVHGGTGYADCSPEHRDAWQSLLDAQHGGAVRLLAPLLHLTKPEVLALAVDGSIPLGLTHSCEAGDTACGRCRSCLDRAILDARA
ncbi:preQ(0) biosynthesis protein QueC [Pseudonocardia autotrophica]|uniref:7-cyano-7-deazaguanine synthase n=2 Tax=Pseudonocardia TaxID=1847 RepID=A0A1Y2MHE9_PSEAH|nr:7-cyano-7-deazaguanine synthase [Pseudonocardia autotrophica]TDN76376.1 preQ(0) biosynthesis protein QueC [Pseudonocardia autotrophica]